MTFIRRFHDILTSTDPRPLVSEVSTQGIDEMTRQGFAMLTARARSGLVTAGIRPGDRVVLVGPNSRAWVAADLAILFEGGVSVPLYARQAADELAAMIADCGPALIVVAHDDLADLLTQAGVTGPIITYDTLFEDGPRVAPIAPRAPDDVVTFVYTSGTSGTAKGAMITAANIDHMLKVTAHALDQFMGGAANDDVVFHYLPFCFMGSRIVLWTTIWRETGIRVSSDLDHLVDEIGVASPHYFLNVPVLLERVRNGANASIATKSIVVEWLYARAQEAWSRHIDGGMRGLDERWFRLADRLIFSGIRKRFGPNLRFLICGSAPLSAETQSWFQMIGVPVYQVYGLTETTAIVTMDRPDQALPGTVGHAIPGAEVRLGDDDELQVRGPMIFPGYHHNPKASDEAFVDGWFRTGDQATIDEHGRIAIVGRVKNLLVPSSGHNIAPEPLEQVLLGAIDGAEQVVVVGHGRAFLTALVTGPARHGDIQRAVDALNAGLPHYKRIRAFHHDDAPLTHEDGLLTANGKLRRRAIEAHFAKAIEGMYA